MKERALYRKVALDRLSSPEQLDQLMQVTSARGWIALTAAAVLLGSFLVWSILGTIPTRVQGAGVLIKAGGVSDVVAPSSGHVGDVAVRAGDLVREGQVVARIVQPGLVDQLREARARLGAQNRRLRELRHFAERDLRLHDDLDASRREAVARSLDAAAEEVEWLSARSAAQEGLLAEGLIRSEDLLATQQRSHQAEVRMRELRGERKQIELQALTRRNRHEQAIADRQLHIMETRREIRRLEDLLREATQVRSPHTGRILEVMAEVGALAQQGNPMMRMDRGAGDDELEAVIYVAGAAGKRVTRGMSVQLSPANVRREEHGYMIGSVATVSEFPATREVMNRVLKNERLVQMLGGTGAPYEAFVSLRLDPGSRDGYAWSAHAPGIPIKSGTLCTATITTSTRRPIELLMPYLRHLTGVK